MRLLLAMCCLTGVAHANTPVPFGLDIQLAEPLVAHHSQVIFDASLSPDLDTAEAELVSLEQSLGPYHPDLAGRMVEVAQLAFQSGDIALAGELYDRALHNARVNNGLYGDQQLPILRGLLDLYLLSGDREAFESRAAYQFRLLGSGLPPFEQGELQAALQFFDVSLDALMDVPWSGRDRDLIRLHDRFDAMAESVCDDDSVKARWCEPFTFRLARFYYLLEFKLEAFVDDPRFERTFSDPNWQSLELEPRLEALQRRLFNRGETALERLLAVDPHSHDALSALADWNWFYRKRDKALKLYSKACGAQPERFRRAGPLPEYPGLAFELAFQEPPVPVHLALTVTERGQPRDVDVQLVDGEDGEAPPGRVRRAVRRMIFRPALDECSDPTDSQLNMDVVFLQ